MASLIVLFLCLSLVNAQDLSPINIQINFQSLTQTPNQLSNQLLSDLAIYQSSWSNRWFSVLRVQSNDHSNNQTSAFIAIDCLSASTVSVNPRSIFKQFVYDCCLTSDGCSSCSEQSGFYETNNQTINQYSVLSSITSVSVQCPNGEFRSVLNACPTSSASQNYIVIIGTVIGVVFFFIFAMIGIWVYRLKKQQSRDRHAQGLKLNDSYQGVKVVPPTQRDSINHQAVVPIQAATIDAAITEQPPTSHTIDVREHKKRPHRRAASMITVDSQAINPSTNQRLSTQVPFEGSGVIAADDVDANIDAAVSIPAAGTTAHQPVVVESNILPLSASPAAILSSNVLDKQPSADASVKPLHKPHVHHRSISVQVHHRQRAASHEHPGKPSTPPAVGSEPPVQVHKRGRSMMLSASQRQALAQEQSHSHSISSDASRRPSMSANTRTKSSSFDTPAVHARLPSVSEPSVHQPRLPSVNEPPHPNSHHHHHHHHHHSRRPSSAEASTDSPESGDHATGRHQRKKSNLMHQRQPSKLELHSLPTVPDTAE